ncbi:MAG: ABC transporter substrate-binding protein [Planctomycetota bacterium]|jgi:multiple sugar transport system substrate-binding protein
MKQKFETENMLFAVFIAALVAVTLAMGLIAFREKSHPPEKTLKVLIPATASDINAQEAFSEAYTRLHPDMAVEDVRFPWRNIWQKLEFMIVAGIPPDVSGIEQPMLPKFIYLDAVEPLDDWIKNDSEFDPSLLFPECMHEANWDGIQYGIPTNFSTVCLFYNKDLFDEEGLEYPNRDWTRSDLLAAARKLTKDHDGDGLIDQFGFFTNNNHWHRYSSWIWTTGGDFFTPDMRRSTFDDPKVVDGFSWLAGLALGKDRVMPGTTDLSAMNSTNMFITGGLAMIAETRYFIRNFGLQSFQDKIKKFEWDVCELPREKVRATVFVCGSQIMPRTVPENRKPMAWDYMKFLASETGQRIVMGLNGPLPARMDLAREKVVHPGEPPENDVAFLNAIEYARYPYRPFPAEEEWTEARGYLQGVWAGQLETEFVCKRSAARLNKQIDDFFKRYPGARLPVKTQWVPFEQREGAGELAGETSGAVGSAGS